MHWSRIQSPALKNLLTVKRIDFACSTKFYITFFLQYSGRRSSSLVKRTWSPSSRQPSSNQVQTKYYTFVLRLQWDEVHHQHLLPAPTVGGSSKSKEFGLRPVDESSLNTFFCAYSGRRSPNQVKGYWSAFSVTRPTATSPALRRVGGVRATVEIR